MFTETIECDKGSGFPGYCFQVYADHLVIQYLVPTSKNYVNIQSIFR